MTNLSFSEQVEQFTRGIVEVITALAPLVLILVILGIAAANAFVEYLYQLAIFGEYAVYPAVLVAGLRFASGMGGITLIKAARYLPGIFFVSMSLALTWYTWQHVGTIAAGIAPAAVEQAVFTISMILWGGFIGELMIAAYMFSTGQMTPTPPADDEDEKTIWRHHPDDEVNLIGERVPVDKPLQADELNSEQARDWLDLMKKTPTLGNESSPSPNGQHRENGHRFHQ